jgi:hypothetical protein
MKGILFHKSRFMYYISTLTMTMAIYSTVVHEPHIAHQLEVYAIWKMYDVITLAGVIKSTLI